LPDARDILDELTQRNVRLSLGGSIHDPNDPVGWLLFNVLAMVAEFEADLTSMRTREGLKVAKAKGRLRGKQPRLSLMQSKHLLELYADGTYTTAELGEMFSVSRATVYRTIHRNPPTVSRFPATIRRDVAVRVLSPERPQSSYVLRTGGAEGHLPRPGRVQGCAHDPPAGSRQRR
jgi:hypothetical protein